MTGCTGERGAPGKRTVPMASASDLTYHLLHVVQNNLEACVAYDLYMKDRQRACDKEAEKLLTVLMAGDKRRIEELVTAITRCAREGRLRWVVVARFHAT
jgi:hypothetical protein